MSQHNRQMSDVRAEANLARLYKSLPKMKVIDLNDDSEFERAVRHVMKRKEKLMQFIARTGLGRSRALQMTRDEITAFCEAAQRNAREDYTDPETMKPKAYPRRFFLDLSSEEAAPQVGF
ncbi:MAG TPA: hypothetical protein VMD77_05600 [Candidatus Baltobacteraceae bacterium]|nr:hypothetical protein [Candidatus Baltobacteraceae bacterium]